MSSIPSLDLVVYPAAGAALGMVYFYVLYRTVRLHVAHASLSKIASLHVFRGGAALTMFWIIAQQGAWPLLLALLGFVMTRFVVQRSIGSL
jgi:hypothetical protein